MGAHQAGGLGEGPLEVSVADLFAAEAPLLFPGRFVFATHQACVGEEVAHLRKTTYLVDLVEQDQAQDLADAGDRAQEGQRRWIVDLGVLQYVPFDGVDLRIVAVDRFSGRLECAIASKHALKRSGEICRAIARVTSSFAVSGGWLYWLLCVDDVRR